MADCSKCKGECCKYITVDLVRPKDAEDWDEVKWMLLHKGVMVYKDYDNDWQVEVRTDCKFLDKKTYKCKIYSKRTQVCKDHGTHECEGNDEDFAKVIFKKPSDVDKYLKELKGKKR